MWRLQTYPLASLSISRFKPKEVSDMYDDHKSYTNRGEGDNHPWRAYPAKFGLFLKVLAKA